MNRFPPLLFLMILSTSLLAQSVDSNAVREQKYALATVTKYCTGVETLSDSQQPRIFAQVLPSLETSSGWVEFESKAAWRQAGQPRPVALVWYNDSNVIRVAVSRGEDNGQSYADYCYRPDGSLAQFRPVPEVQTRCDELLFHCDVTFRGGLRVYTAEGILAAPPLAERHEQKSPPAVQAQEFDFLGSLFLAPLKPEKTNISFGPIWWPEYMKVSELPFIQLFYASTKTKR